MTSERPKKGLGTQVARGAGWSFLGYGAAQVLKLVSTLVMTRLLSPDAFGRMALVQGFIQAFWMFSDIGVGPCLIQNKKGASPAFLNTAWTMALVRGFLLWVVATAFAVPFASMYEDGLLAYLIPAAALVSVLAGFDSTKLIMQNRELALGRLTLIDLLSQGAGLVVMIVWGLFHPTAWALVAGQIATAIVKLWMSHAFLPGVKNRLRWDKSAARTLFSFGKWVFVSTSLMFLSNYTDRLIFGKMVDLRMLGIYSVAASLANIPIMLVGLLSQRLLFPLFSIVHNEGSGLRSTYLRVRWVILLVTAWGISGLLAGGPTALRLICPPKYHDGGWIVQLLALGGLFYAIESTNGAALLARGKPQWGAAVNVAKILAMAAIVYPSWKLWGFPGAVASFSATNLARYAVSLIGIRKEGLGGLAHDLGILALVLLSSVVGWVGSSLILRWHGPVVLEAFVVFVGVSSIWAVPGMKLWKEIRRVGFEQAVLRNGEGDVS